MTAAQSRIIQLLHDGWTIHNSYLGPYATRGPAFRDLNLRTIRSMLRLRLLVLNNSRIILPTPVHK